MPRKPKSKTPTMDAIVEHARAIPGATRTQAEALGIDHSKWCRLLRGQRPPILADLDQMAKALGLTIRIAKS